MSAQTSLDDLVADLDARRSKARAMGGDDAATRHLERPWRKHGVPPV